MILKAVIFDSYITRLNTLLLNFYNNALPFYHKYLTNQLQLFALSSKCIGLIASYHFLQRKLKQFLNSSVCCFFFLNINKYNKLKNTLSYLLTSTFLFTNNSTKSSYCA